MQYALVLHQGCVPNSQYHPWFFEADDDAQALHKVASSYNLGPDFNIYEFNRLGLKSIIRIEGDDKTRIFPNKRTLRNNPDWIRENYICGVVKKVKMQTAVDGLEMQAIELDEGNRVLVYDPFARREFEWLDVKEEDEILFTFQVKCKNLGSRLTIWRNGQFFWEKFLGAQDFDFFQL